uniref:Uncharacterized protein n=1 Tax=Anguilla anguilla TaxID=7936 RepID=A0A0E9UAM0_ANGAN
MMNSDRFLCADTGESYGLAISIQIDPLFWAIC